MRVYTPNITLGLCVLFAIACDSAEPAPQSTAPIIDNDGDGYVEGEDCNDEDPAIHPGAVERCDQVDNNCDGITDNGLLRVELDGETGELSPRPGAGVSFLSKIDNQKDWIEALWFDGYGQPRQYEHMIDGQVVELQTWENINDDRGRLVERFRSGFSVFLSEGID